MSFVISHDRQRCYDRVIRNGTDNWQLSVIGQAPPIAVSQSTLGLIEATRIMYRNKTLLRQRVSSCHSVTYFSHLLFNISIYIRKITLKRSKIIRLYVEVEF